MRRLFFSLSSLLFSVAVWAQENPHITPGNGGHGKDAMMASSPFSVYTAGVVAYVLVVGLLVLTLLVGAFLVVNLGLMSKRAEDEIGGREWQEPSEVGIMRHERFGDKSQRRILPPEEDSDQVTATIHELPRVPDGAVLREENMLPDVSLERERKKRERTTRRAA